jgi:hypothetical protein
VTTPSIDMVAIRDALCAARDHSEGRYAPFGWAAIRRAEAAIREFDKLQGQWQRALTLMAEADRAYDRYVTSPELDGPGGSCSCHIMPPCSYCLSLPDPDAPAEDPEAIA